MGHSGGKFTFPPFWVYMGEVRFWAVNPADEMARFGPLGNILYLCPGHFHRMFRQNHHFNANREYVKHKQNDAKHESEHESEHAGSVLRHAPVGHPDPPPT